MEFALQTTNPAKWDVDVLILFCWENEDCVMPNITDGLPQMIHDLAEKESFTGKKGQFLVFTPCNFTTAYKVVIAGLGPQQTCSIAQIQHRVAVVARKMQKETKPDTLGVVPVREWFSGPETKERVAAVVEGIFLSNYRFLTYQKEEQLKNRPVTTVYIWVPSGKLTAAEEGIVQGSIAARATIFARDLVNEPPQVTTPTFLAAVAQDIAKQSIGRVTTQVMDRKEIEKLGMGAFLGVSRGSEEPPKFIRLHYKGKKGNKKVVLIGKGITFDTGGLSLKMADHMESMKLDMAGAAAVLAVFRAVTTLQPDIEVVGLIAACENMPSGKALRPGDILQAYNGKTIEVLNTDAEGRLTLADMLSYAVAKEQPDMMIDLATLTGACMIGLGADIAGLWSNNEHLRTNLISAAANTGELVWPMPLEPAYKKLIQSHIADVKNIQTGKYGRAITAALFLEEFVGTTPWAHLDIAGPSYSEKETALIPQGGTGFGVRMLLHFLSSVV